MAKTAKAAETAKDPTATRAIEAFKRHVLAGADRATFRYTSDDKTFGEVTLIYPDGSIASGNVYLYDSDYNVHIHTTYSVKDGWQHPHLRFRGNW